MSATSVVVFGSAGDTQPIQVVQKAIEKKQSAEADDSGSCPFDHVWCVIDGDYGQKIRPARELAVKNGVQIAVTTICFEYWVLLHFVESDKSSGDCDGMVSRLKMQISSYTKGSFDFSEIVGNVKEAARRAKKLRLPGIKRNELPENQNPCSELYQIVDVIFSN